MTIEALNCPNCGAGVASDSVQCEFCRSRLKTMACPSCFGTMFVGSRFCGHCGKKMTVAETVEAIGLGNCPRCSVGLEMIAVDATNLRECSKCSGLWVDVETFEVVCADRERSSAVLGFFKERHEIAEALAEVRYVPCPDCGELMNRSNFARASGVIIDTCRPHGVWFDADELPKIIEFIQRGGMEIARERERMEIRDERDRLREEARKQALVDRRFALSKFDSNNDARGVLGFIGNLFD